MTLRLSYITVQVIAAILVDLLTDWNALPFPADQKGFFQNRKFFVMVFGLGLFWPLGLLPSLHNLRHVSLVATTAMCYVVIVVVVRMFEALSKGSVCLIEDPDVECATLFHPRDSTFMDYASAVSAFSFALTTHTALPPILSELNRPSPKRVSIVIHSMVWFCYFMYVVTGIAGYLLFGSRVCPLISNSFHKTDRFIQAGQASVVVTIADSQFNRIYVFS